MNASMASGPLKGVRIVEFTGIGPGPFAAMLLADMGAEVVRVDRRGATAIDVCDLVSRSRSAVVHLDLKQPEDRDQALQLLAHADALIEGFRPGVMERLGLGPDAVLAANPRIVYGRMTGWGQSGPLSHAAGHDINYISLPGALAAMGQPGQPPMPPLNLVGDYGGGSLYLCMGLLAALLEARGSGQGQVVDAAMCDGVASLMTQFVAMAATGKWTDKRQDNLLDGGAPFYGTYACSDGKYISVGPIEPQFYALLRDKLALTDPIFDRQNDKAMWPEIREKLAAVLTQRTQAHWCELLEGTDACVAPILTMAEAASHPHLAARQTFVTHNGIVQPAPAPRFTRTPSAIQGAPLQSAVSVAALVAQWCGNQAAAG
ncbi:MAG: CaiB/BaiF CoA-transferase family protein [Devosia sp.]